MVQVIVPIRTEREMVGLMTVLQRENYTVEMASKYMPEINGQFICVIWGDWSVSNLGTIDVGPDVIHADNCDEMAFLSLVHMYFVHGDRHE